MKRFYVESGLAVPSAGISSDLREAETNQLVDRIIEDLWGEIYSFDARAMTFVGVNAVARKNLQYSMAELRHMTPLDLQPDMEPHDLRALLRPLIQGNEDKITFATRHRRKDGSLYDVDVTVRMLDQPRPIFIATVKDTTEERRSKAEAKEAKDALAVAIEALPDGFVLYDSADRLVVCNERYREIYPQSAPAMTVGAAFPDILRYGLERGQYAEAIGREDEWLEERLTKHRAADACLEQQLGDGRWLRILEQPTPDGGRVGLRVDITELKQQQETLRTMARTDVMTGLLNRRGLAETLKDYTQREGRFALLHIDLDKFKSVNDVHGHLAGDALLMACARVLAQLDSVVARVGGDEFVAACFTDRSPAQIMARAEQLIRDLAEPVVWRDRQLRVGASIGVAISDSGDDFVAAQNNAGTALMHAKQAGRNRAVLFRPEMRTQAMEQAELAQDMRLGIERDEFEPFFQPILAIEDGCTIGAEALLRWKHPTRGLLSAEQFLPVAQDAGLLAVLDEVMLQKCCKAVRLMCETGEIAPQISLNASNFHLCNPGMVEKIVATIVDHGLSPAQFRFEILESLLLDERAGRVTDTVLRLSEAGFAIDLDDFGTGHAAIVNLRRLPVQRIKIDRSLVQGIGADKKLQIITGAIVALGRQLEMEVLAEGIESRADLEQMTDLGCTSAQGYGLAQPMGLRQLRAWLRENG